MVRCFHLAAQSCEDEETWSPFVFFPAASRDMAIRTSGKYTVAMTKILRESSHACILVFELNLRSS